MHLETGAAGTLSCHMRLQREQALRDSELKRAIRRVQSQCPDQRERSIQRQLLQRGWQEQIRRLPLHMQRMLIGACTGMEAAQLSAIGQDQSCKLQIAIDLRPR